MHGKEGIFQHYRNTVLLVLSNRHDVDSPLGNYIGNFVTLTKVRSRLGLQNFQFCNLDLSLGQVYKISNVISNARFSPA